uniref:LAMP n=1 Tax=Human herpesvirus 8 TaxID=37296 RepID=Q91GT9_HHV8|nr:LAMP [Human gammaherpesvirus 8]
MNYKKYLWGTWFAALITCCGCLSIMFCLLTINLENTIFLLSNISVYYQLFCTITNIYVQSKKQRFQASPPLGPSIIVGCIAFASWSFSTQSTLSTVCVCIISLLSIITAILSLGGTLRVVKCTIDSGLLCIAMVLVLIFSMGLQIYNNWTHCQFFLPLWTLLLVFFIHIFATNNGPCLKLAACVFAICGGILKATPAFFCVSHSCLSVITAGCISCIHIGMTGLFITMKRHWIGSTKGLMSFLLLQGGVLVTLTTTIGILFIKREQDTNNEGSITLLAGCGFLLYCFFCWQSFHKASLSGGFLFLFLAWTCAGCCVKLVLLYTDGWTTGVTSGLICVIVILSTGQAVLVGYLYRESRLVSFNNVTTRLPIYTPHDTPHAHAGRICPDVNHLARRLPPLPSRNLIHSRILSSTTDMALSPIRVCNTEVTTQLEMQQLHNEHTVTYASILGDNTPPPTRASACINQSGISNVSNCGVRSLDPPPFQPADEVYEEVLFPTD